MAFIFAVVFGIILAAIAFAVASWYTTLCSPFLSTAGQIMGGVSAGVGTGITILTAVAGAPVTATAAGIGALVSGAGTAICNLVSIGDVSLQQNVMGGVQHGQRSLVLDYTLEQSTTWNGNEDELRHHLRRYLKCRQYTTLTCDTTSYRTHLRDELGAHVNDQLHGNWSISVREPGETTPHIHNYTADTLRIPVDENTAVLALPNGKKWLVTLQAEGGEGVARVTAESGSP